MMKTVKTGWLVILSAIVFTLLFYKQSLGLNLLIYESLILGCLFALKAIDVSEKLQLAGVIAVVLTVIFTILHHSLLSFIVNFSVFFLFIGWISIPQVRSIPLVALNSFSAFFEVQGKFKNEFSLKSTRSKRTAYRLKRLSIFIIPFIIIVVFISIYSASNPKFGKFFNWLSQKFGLLMDHILQLVEFKSILVLFLGIIFGSFIFLRYRSQRAVEADAKSSDQLVRRKRRTKRTFRLLALFNEYRAAIFLLAFLNILLLFLNSMDIYWVWFNFKWEGQYLKEFVHQGTYLLLVSILISVGLLLYFFRKNLNFYQKNSLLKKLSYIWILQNAVLVVSVGIRNSYYIMYYAMAYKRIAIVFFLILTLFLLFTVYQKIAKTNSSYYMIRVNSLALVLVFVVASAFNWDRIIARYNLSKADRSFVHLNYLSTLSNSALPYLDRSLEDLEQIDQRQLKKFTSSDSYGSSSISLYKRTYMSPENYFKTIQFRKRKFKSQWKQKSWLSWNLAEEMVYRKM